MPVRTEDELSVIKACSGKFGNRSTACFASVQIYRHICIPVKGSDDIMPCVIIGGNLVALDICALSLDTGDIYTDIIEIVVAAGSVVVSNRQSHVGAGGIVFIADQSRIVCSVPFASVPESERKVRGPESDAVLFSKGYVRFCFISLPMVLSVGNLDCLAFYSVNELDIAYDGAVRLGGGTVICRPIVKGNVKSGLSIPVDRRLHRFVHLIQSLYLRCAQDIAVHAQFIYRSSGCAVGMDAVCAKDKVLSCHIKA